MADQPLTPERVVRLLLGVIPESVVVGLVWKWEQRGIIEQHNGSYRWTEAQRKRGGTIQW
jgi:hypothetical protein